MRKINFNLFMDLHNHTVWSDGADKPEDIIRNAIEHNLNMVGITDHQIFFDLLQQQINDKKTKMFIDAVKARRIPVSVGSDTHCLVHYDFGRLKRANDIARMLNLSGEEVKF